MGRMLDALKKAEGKRLAVHLEEPPLNAVWPEDEEANDIPFVEVGGPKLADPAPEPAHQSEPALVIPSATATPGWMSVAFRPVGLPVVTEPQPGALAAELLTWHQPAHPISEQYRALADSLLATVPVESPRVLLFTGSAPGAGVTTVLLNTAITLAREGLRVAVVDAHPKQAAIARRLGLSDAPGLRDVLAGSWSLDHALRKTPVANLQALTSGSGEAGATRGAAEKMRQVLGQLRGRCDVVLVDGPVWDGRPEIIALACACDAVYLCIPEAEQESSRARALLDVIPEQGGTLRGCIVTSR
jgi:Mrp family chromosome partitioning ATPase